MSNPAKLNCFNWYAWRQRVNCNPRRWDWSISANSDLVPALALLVGYYAKRDLATGVTNLFKLVSQVATPRSSCSCHDKHGWPRCSMQEFKLGCGGKVPKMGFGYSYLLWFHQRTKPTTEPSPTVPSMKRCDIGMTSQAITTSPSETIAPARVPGTDKVPNVPRDAGRCLSARRSVGVTSLLWFIWHSAELLHFKAPDSQCNTFSTY